MKRTSKSTRILLLLLVLAVAAGTYVWLHAGQVSTDDAMIDGRTVSLSPKVAGYVKALNVTDNQMVKADDILLEVDPADYALRRDRAAAMLEAAQAAVSSSQRNVEATSVSAPSNLTAAQAQVAAAEANWNKAQLALARMKKLGREARSQQQLEEAVAAEKSARSNLEDVRARLRSAATAPKVIAQARANHDQLQAQVKQAQVELAQAELDLANTKLIAPMDGRITRRGVERGDYVQPGQQLASLVGNELWVTADFKETQLTHIAPGQPVDIRIDAFPDVKLHGKVDSIQYGTGAYFSAFPPENASGNFVKTVQRVPVKILFDSAPDSKLALGPGMSVVPTVHTDGGNLRHD